MTDRSTSRPSRRPSRSIRRSTGRSSRRPPRPGVRRSRSCRRRRSRRTSSTPSRSGPRSATLTASRRPRSRRSRSGPPRARRSSASGRSPARPTSTGPPTSRSASPTGWPGPATQAAFSARIGTKELKGKFSWFEDDTVLAFEPSSLLPYGAKVVMTVAATATDKNGIPLSGPKNATFKVASKPKPGAPARSVHIGHGKSVGAGAWGAVERYYLKLMNCTRGGGWVTSGGNCSSPGGSGINPLILSSGISTNVSRPYAKFLAGNGGCRPLPRRRSGGPAAPGGLRRRLPREHRLPLGEQPVRVGPGHAPVLPGREAVRWLLPLCQHHVDEDEVRRHRGLGGPRAGPPRGRFLGRLNPADPQRRPPYQQRTAAPGGPVLAADRRRCCRGLHEPARAERQSPGLRRRHRVGLRLPADAHPVHRDRAGDDRADRRRRPAEAGGGRLHRSRSPRPEEELEIDEDFLRRVRDV